MELDLSNKNLTTFEGIDLPDGLIELYCHNNPLSSLPSLPTSLRMLCCYENQLTSLPPLPPTLEKLYCSYNELTSLPPLPPTLTHLHCGGNRLTSLPPLPQSLTILYCSGGGLPPHYYKGGLLKSISELRVIIQVDTLKKAFDIVRRLISDRAARNIQRVWKRYWLKPYYDPQLGYPVSRYLLHYQGELNK